MAHKERSAIILYTKIGILTTFLEKDNKFMRKINTGNC